MKTITTHKRIKVTVNNRQIEVYDDLTILQALLQEDIHIPHLCYDIRLERSNGNCGLCVVEVGEENNKRDVKACQTPIKEGMFISTNSPKLESYRKVRLEQILSDHYAFLPISLPLTQLLPNLGTLFQIEQVKSILHVIITE